MKWVWFRLNFFISRIFFIKNRHVTIVMTHMSVSDCWSRTSRKIFASTTYQLLPNTVCPKNGYLTLRSSYSPFKNKFIIKPNFVIVPPKYQFKTDTETLVLYTGAALGGWSAGQDRLKRREARDRREKERRQGCHEAQSEKKDEQMHGTHESDMTLAVNFGAEEVGAAPWRSLCPGSELRLPDEQRLALRRPPTEEQLPKSQRSFSNLMCGGSDEEGDLRMMCAVLKHVSSVEWDSDCSENAVFRQRSLGRRDTEFQGFRESDEECEDENPVKRARGSMVRGLLHRQAKFRIGFEASKSIDFFSEHGGSVEIVQPFFSSPVTAVGTPPYCPFTVPFFGGVAPTESDINRDLQRRLLDSGAARELAKVEASLARVTVGSCPS